MVDLSKMPGHRNSKSFQAVHARLTFEQYLTFIPARDREAVIERAAIMEFEGNQSRELAEWNALMNWKRRRA